MRKSSAPKSLLFGCLLTTIFLFQNCSSIFQSSALVFNPNEILLSSKAAGADFSWLINPVEFSLALSEFDYVEKWIDAGNNHVPLYPPFMPYSQLLDMSHSARLVESPRGQQLHFSPNTVLSSIPQDASQFASDDYSALLFLSDIRMPIEEPKIIRLMSLQPEDVANNGGLTLDLIETDDSAELVAQQWFSAEAYAQNSLSFSKDALKKGLALGVRFSSDAQALEVTVNGETSDKKPILTGILPRLGYVDRTLTLHPPSANSSGSFQLSDFGLFKRAISDLEMREFTMGLLQNYEFSKPTPMANLTGLIPMENSLINFAQIKPLFEKTVGNNSCVGCHSELSSRNQTLNMSSFGRLWIQPGNPNGSLLVQAIRHHGTAQPMPKGGGQMSEADIQRIEQWIQQGAW